MGGFAVFMGLSAVWVVVAAVLIATGRLSVYEATMASSLGYLAVIAVLTTVGIYRDRAQPASRGVREA